MTARRLRLATIASTVLFLAPAAATPVAGATGITELTNGVGGSYVQQGPAGLFPAACGEVGVELVPDPLPVPWVWMTAFEFSLSGLPPGATISFSELSVTPANTNPDPINVYGYAGDGVITAADFAPSGTPVVYIPTPVNPEQDLININLLISPTAIASGWIGLLFVAQFDGSTTVHQSLGCPGDADYPFGAILWQTSDLPNTAIAPRDPSDVDLAVVLGTLVVAGVTVVALHARLKRKRPSASLTLDPNEAPEKMVEV